MRLHGQDARTSSELLTLVAGQGDMGGGEHMLLRIGEAARVLGWDIQVVGPSWGTLRAACESREFRYIACRGKDRRSFAAAAVPLLSRPNLGLVWANGALPALMATSTPNRLVVHLHQRPSPGQSLAIQAARKRARRVLVPSRSMRSAIGGASVLLNWTEDLRLLDRRPDPDVLTVAYLGRVSVDKGVETLARAVDDLSRQPGPGAIRLLIAGDTRFVPHESVLRVRRALESCNAEVVELGWSSPREVLSQASVVVVPSLWPEPFGLVAAEAMAMGCPLVVSGAGALPEVVGPKYRWQFPAGDSEALCALLGEIRSKQMVESVAEMRDRWQEMFSPTAGLRRLEAVLHELRSGRER